MRNILQKSVVKTGYSQPKKGMRTPFGYFFIETLVAVQLTM